MKTKNEIITTPNEVASYVTWIANDLMMKFKSKDFELQVLTAELFDKFKQDTIKKVKAGILKEAPRNYQEQKYLLSLYDEERREKKEQQ
ncbi:MAG: hypothetical protein ABSF81_13455 [Bacteroidales bacterium]